MVSHRHGGDVRRRRGGHGQVVARGDLADCRREATLHRLEGAAVERDVRRHASRLRCVARRDLGRPTLDCYLLHWRGSVPLGETMRALEKLVADGKIRALGVSNFDVADLEEAQTVLERSRSRATKCSTIWANQRTVEDHELPYCRRTSDRDRRLHAVGRPATGPTTGCPQRLSRSPAQARRDPRNQVILAFLTRDPLGFAIPKPPRSSILRKNAGAGRPASRRSRYRRD